VRWRGFAGGLPLRTAYGMITGNGNKGRESDAAYRQGGVA
jgi:hypothetical protein